MQLTCQTLTGHGFTARTFSPPRLPHPLTINETLNTSSTTSIRNLRTLHLVLRLHGGMQIFVLLKTNKATYLIVNSANTVADVKVMIQDQEGILPSMQLLYFNSELLLDDRTLASYNIQNGSTLHMLLR
ncbi:hypothetical protein N665_0066s0047 [Sinapis alba]|nr:hypothetical protein N665_0066s0047 [Sinapis alba]